MKCDKTAACEGNYTDLHPCYTCSSEPRYTVQREEFALSLDHFNYHY